VVNFFGLGWVLDKISWLMNYCESKLWPVLAHCVGWVRLDQFFWARRNQVARVGCPKLKPKVSG
jgi:hypothetical protein